MFMTGVCCITTYVSKRKKELTFRGGWYVYLDFHDVIFLQNVPTSSKRKFFLTFRNVTCYTTDPRLQDVRLYCLVQSST